MKYPKTWIRSPFSNSFTISTFSPYTEQFVYSLPFPYFFTAGVGVLKTLVTAIGAGLGAWGVINLMEGYGNDNPGAKSQGIKQFMAR